MLLKLGLYTMVQNRNTQIRVVGEREKKKKKAFTALQGKGDQSKPMADCALL